MRPQQEPHSSPQPPTTPDAVAAPIIMHTSVHGHAQAVIVSQKNTDECRCPRGGDGNGGPPALRHVVKLKPTMIEDYRVKGG